MKLKALILLIFYFFLPKIANYSVNAQDDRWYRYEKILTVINVNKDTSFDVTETQTFEFQGEYHQGYRGIPYNKIDAITDISVYDETNQLPFKYSSTRLNKSEPESWGKYTTYRESGKQIIEWYYDARDEVRDWTLKYKVLGGLEFGQDYDRLYWNIFTDYDVPVSSAGVQVILPDKVPADPNKIFAYRTNSQYPIDRSTAESQVIEYRSADFSPGEAFTVDVSWPKGYIDRSSYWWTWLRLYWGYVGGALVVLFCIITGFIYWLTTEKLPQEQLTVVPEYQPPRNLRPAIAEVIIRESLTPKGLAATVVDLAVRGYLKIEEKPGGWLSNIQLIILLIAVFFGGFIFISITTNTILGWVPYAFPGFLLFILTFVVALTRKLKDGGELFTRRKNYLVSKVKELDWQGTDEYERRYVDVLMRGLEAFTTDDLRNTKDPGLRTEIEKVKNQIYEEANVKTKAFDVDPLAEKNKWLIWTLLFVGILVAFGWAKGNATQPVIFIGSLIAGIAGLWAYTRFEARLKREGMILKNEWQGFKLYLETAEKGEMAKVKPDLFPQYLPYAMIFGVENKWAKAFAHVDVPVQSWYVGSGSYVSGSGGFSGSGSFSGFSASFSSSFASAFASSAGGGSGGGGGAGGGGGGGGGGAS